MPRSIKFLDPVIDLFKTPTWALPSVETDQTKATPSNQSPVFQTNFASLSFYGNDKILLDGFPVPILGLLKMTVSKSWPRGIQCARDCRGVKELVLRGYPWLSVGSNSVQARRLVKQILVALYNEGWVLTLSTSIFKWRHDKDSMIFRHQTPVPVPCEWMCISFAYLDSIRLIDAPQTVLDEMVETLSFCTHRHGIYMPNAYVIQLKGNPWASRIHHRAITARRLQLILINVLEANGFTVYASIVQDMSFIKETKNGKVADTWHCCRALDWTPGMPVYHA
ncbi:hypothetical protein M501DRAFT_938366 [Patellaria atrata CBS 101060]|uniref:Uncharacterized protein n=1 Tax=Patellaria atrata CBS 101060 TaxID=1346257 RepID=A0A9P4S6M3_9PEZI|nr:hypothetical protein M501DRAFT_938366 [Patellaria atrata CBS 101060]